MIRAMTTKREEDPLSRKRHFALFWLSPIGLYVMGWLIYLITDDVHSSIAAVAVFGAMGYANHGDVFTPDRSRVR